MELFQLENKRHALTAVPLSLNLYLFLPLDRCNKTRAYSNDKMNEPGSLTAPRQHAPEQLAALLPTLIVYERDDACEWTWPKKQPVN